MQIPRRTEEWELRVYYAKYDPKTRDAAKMYSYYSACFNNNLVVLLLILFLHSAFTEVCKSNGITVSIVKK